MSTFRRLNARILLLQNHRKDDGCGGLTEEWKLLGSAWASIKNKTLSHPTHNTLQGMRLGGIAGKDQVFQVITRDHLAPEQGMRIQWGQKILSIISEPMPAPERGLIIYYASLLKQDEVSHDAR